MVKLQSHTGGFLGREAGAPHLHAAADQSRGWVSLGTAVAISAISKVQHDLRLTIPDNQLIPRHRPEMRRCNWRLSRLRYFDLGGFKNQIFIAKNFWT